MPQVAVNCSNCNKLFYRPTRRSNEALKFNWRQFCSPDCLSRSRLKSMRLTCELCGKDFNRQPSHILAHNYCSHSCSAKVSNKLRAKVREPKRCLECGKKFMGERKYCSSGCWTKRESRYSQKDLLNAVKNFTADNGRLPVKREMQKYYKLARKYFGTWNNAIKAAGFDPNPVMFANKHIAKDGHRCDSLTEKIIDDWFYKRKIKHQRNVSYPGDKKFSCDFVIGDKWVEFFGLYGEHVRYDQLRRQKIKLAKENNLNLIKVYPGDIFPKNRLKEIFRKN